MEATATQSKGRSGARHRPMLIGGEWREGRATSDVVDPYRGELVARAPGSSLDDLNDALAAAVARQGRGGGDAGLRAGGAAAPRRRAAARARRRDRATMARETGKAIKDARAEVVRSQDTVSARPPRRRSASRASTCRSTAARWAPARSPCCCAFRWAWSPASRRSTRPSTWPATRSRRRSRPATPIVLKPPPQAPLTVHKIVKMFVDAGAPAGFRQRGLWRRGRAGAGARPAGRFHHLHRLEPGRRRDQGGVRACGG